MAIALPSTSSDYATANGTTGTSIVVNKPTNTADGDYLIAVIYNQLAGATFTKPTGWTEIYHTTASSTRGFGAYYKYIPSAASETATNYTWTASGSARWIGQIFRMTGANTTTLVDATPTSDAYNSTSSSTVTDPAVTAAGSAAFALAFNFTNNSTAVYQTLSLSGWTPYLNSTVTSGSSTSVVDVQYKQLSASGTTGTAAFTMSPAAATAGGFLVTFNPAPVASTATGSFTWTGSGSAAAAASATGAFAWSGTATGVSGTVNTATGAFTFTGTATAQVGAAASGAFGWSGSAYSTTPIIAAVTGSTPLYIGHRGGNSGTYGEETLPNYTATAAQYSKALLEVSVWKCSTGEYVCSHDQNTSRVFGTAYDIPTTSWTTLSTLTSTVGGNLIRRLSDIVSAFPTRLFVIDNKANTNDTTLISYLNSNLPGQWMGKGYFSSKTWLQACQGQGVPIWAYFYPTDLGSLATAVGNYPTTTPVLFGLGDYSSSGAGLPVQSDANTYFSFLASYPAIRSWAHIPLTLTQKQTADTQAATAGGVFNGYMVQGFPAVAPNDTGTATGSFAWSGSGTAKAAATATGAFAWTGTSGATVQATAAGAFSWTGTTSAKAAATATGAFGWTGSSAASVAASAAGNFGWTGTGTPAAAASATGGFTLTGSGTAAAGASAAGAFTWSGTSTGGVAGVNTATGSFTWTGQATASAGAAATGAFAFTGSSSAAGGATAVGGFVWVGSSSGSSGAPNAATGAWVFTGTATARPAATAIGSFTFAGSASSQSGQRDLELTDITIGPDPWATSAGTGRWSGDTGSDRWKTGVN